MKPTPILLDVDAGVDDTLATILALLSPHLHVRGITTVAGNVTVRLCTRNILLTLEVIASFVGDLPPVATGASKPLRRRLFTAKEVHGRDGIGGASEFYPSPKLRPTPGVAVELMLDTV